MVEIWYRHFHFSKMFKFQSKKYLWIENGKTVVSVCTFLLNLDFFSVPRFVIPIFLFMLPSFCMANRCSDEDIYAALEVFSKNDKPEFADCMMKNFRVNNVAKLSKFDTPCDYPTYYFLDSSDSFYGNAVSECNPKATVIVLVVSVLSFLLALSIVACIVGVAKFCNRSLFKPTSFENSNSILVWQNTKKRSYCLPL